MQSLNQDLFTDPRLDANDELMVAGDTGTGTSTTCTPGTSEAEVEGETDGRDIVIAGVGCDWT